MTHLYIDSGRCSPSKMKRSNRILFWQWVLRCQLTTVGIRLQFCLENWWQISVGDIIVDKSCDKTHVTDKNEILPPRQRRNHTTNPIRIEWKNSLMKSTSWFWFIWTRSIFGSFFLLKMAIFDQKWPVKMADVVEVDFCDVKDPK